MTGTLINVITVIIGSLIGLTLNAGFPERLKNAIFNSLGLITFFLGMQMAFESQKILVVVFSILLGVFTGEILRLEERFERLTARFKRRIGNTNENFTDGLVTSFLLFCIGAMTITGSIEEGLGNPPRLLLTKALMDGFSSMALASALGSGVLFSVIPLFLFQGGLTLLAAQLKDFMSVAMMSELTATGGIMMIGLGINLLGLGKRVSVFNMLPALIYAVLLTLLISKIHIAGFVL